MTHVSPALGPPQAPGESLSATLRRRTRAAHGRVRVLPLLKAYFQGRLGRAAVVEGLCALRAVYRSLERQLPRHPVVAQLAPPELLRTDALSRDLEVLVASGWPPPTGPHPAALAYAARIEQVSDRDPLLLGAHAYARYLGDLAGGPIARRAAPWVLSLPEGFCFAYLDHPQISDPIAYRAGFRERIDALPVVDREPMVAEVLEAFRLHTELSAELWRVCVEGGAPAGA